MSVMQRVGAGFAAVALVAASALPSSAAEDVSISMRKHARPTASGGLLLQVQVRCGPLPGTPDFTEGYAGAYQPKTGAEAEGGLSPDLVCDGIERTYTAGMSPISDVGFKRGPAAASVSLIACSVVGDEQVCINGSASRRIVLSGRAGA